MERTEHPYDIRFWLAGTAVVTLGCLVFLSQELNKAGVLQTPRWLVVMGIGVLGILMQVGLLAAIWLGKNHSVYTWLATVFAALRRLGKANLVLYLGLCAFIAWLALGRYGDYFDRAQMRLALFLLATCVGAVLLAAAGIRGSWKVLLAASLLCMAAAFRIALYSGELSTRPISLNWSEASRYYYASLFFSKQIYGFAVPPTVLHPSRYLMQAAPFLLTGAPLWLHRLWQVMLWVGVTAISSALLARRLRIGDPLQRWMVAAWAFVFLLIGPVYYHLQIPLILVLGWFDRKRFWRTMLVVGAASLWAGISRVNWFPAAGLLASALYFLEQPVSSMAVWRYLIRPVMWSTLGTILAFGAQAAYALLSGNPPDQFASSLTSDLLWYRLLPNITYPTGVLPMAALVSAPLLVLVGLQRGEKWRCYHPIRLLGIASILLVLFAGGLVVSVKIGGGSNLHNLDVFLAFLMIFTAYGFFDRAVPDDGHEAEPGVAPGRSQTRAALLLTAFSLTLLAPVYLTITAGEQIGTYDRTAVEYDLERLIRLTKDASEKGEVLFISQRQLLTFNVIDGIRLVPEYEKVFLMEMAMADNQVYLGQYWEDLENHRFSMIVTDPLFLRYKGVTDSFGEENDAWVKNVAEKTLCYYEQYRMLRSMSLQLLVPREDGESCISGQALP